MSDLILQALIHPSEYVLHSREHQRRNQGPKKSEIIISMTTPPKCIIRNFGRQGCFRQKLYVVGFLYLIYCGKKCTVTSKMIQLIHSKTILDHDSIYISGLLPPLHTISNVYQNACWYAASKISKGLQKVWRHWVYDCIAHRLYTLVCECKFWTVFNYLPVGASQLKIMPWI